MAISITDGAREKLLNVMQREGMDPTDAAFRVGVKGGGCAGFEYNLSFDSKKDQFDKEFVFDGLRIIIDPKSYFFLNGMTMDWKDTLLEQRFVFTNPNAKAACGCGTSFAV